MIKKIMSTLKRKIHGCIILHYFLILPLTIAKESAIFKEILTAFLFKVPL